MTEFKVYGDKGLKSKRQTFRDGFCIFLWADWTPWPWKIWVPLHFDCQRMKNSSVGRCTCWLVGEGRPRLIAGWEWGGADTNNFHARVWRNFQKSSLEPQRKVKGSGMERVALGGGPLPMNDQKKSILVAGEWVSEKKKKHIEKWSDLVFVPLTSVPKEKTWRVIWGTCLCQYC